MDSGDKLQSVVEPVFRGTIRQELKGFKLQTWIEVVEVVVELLSLY